MQSGIFESADSVRQKINVNAASGRGFFFAVDYEMAEGIFVAREDFETSPVKFRTGQFSNRQSGAKPGQKPGALKSFPIPFGEYAAKFERVKNALLHGDTFLANLTIRTEVESSSGLSEIFECANGPYMLYVPEHFVCFSPECFIRTSGGKIFAKPMKGTIEAATREEAERILCDPKESEEHNTIVDLIRNDLHFAAERVAVSRFKYLEAIGRSSGLPIWQTSSEICGNLRPGIKMGDAIFSMLPAGSVSGAPKKRTVEVLAQAEGEKRGFYTGVFGTFDGKDFDCGVAIRFIESRNGKLFYRSGGGITCKSSADAEYAEALVKIYLPI